MNNVNFTKGIKYNRVQYTVIFTVNDIQKEITLSPGIPIRDEIIDAIITDGYPLDKMQALHNNYFLDPTDEEIIEQMNVMQNYRKMAKQIADEFLKMIEDE